MRCEQAEQLFDAYLSGELSVTLATELGAHRLRCPDCRRALALMEVAGHIVASDKDTVTIGEQFPDRLLACMDDPRSSWWCRARRVMYLAGPLAAAAVIALAFLGVFDRGRGIRAGEEVTAPGPVVIDDSRNDSPDPGEASGRVGGSAGGLEDFVKRAQRNMTTKRQSGESLQEALDMTILQVLDILEEGKDASATEDHFPGADPSASPDTAVPDDGAGSAGP